MDLRWRGYLAKMPASVSLATQGPMPGVTKIHGERPCDSPSARALYDSVVPVRHREFPPFFSCADRRPATVALVATVARRLPLLPRQRGPCVIRFASSQDGGEMAGGSGRQRPPSAPILGSASARARGRPVGRVVAPVRGGCRPARLVLEALRRHGDGRDRV